MSERDELERYFLDVLRWLRDRGVTVERMWALLLVHQGEGVTHQTGTPPDQ